ncbi:Flagellar hook-length control protein FliK [Candidatus Bealeia paramacronuclearis]|uniref:Flagellar hook-length control protein FliK n=1 Tax=Candidatus Bealeia paramacronuclearis TaxID=1921001 RepID=A0ABZ2C8Z6_9PROT|nr:Flagellar hook-length control protein FliK [Candidatus Bealeia paramacronuclearis]
MLEIINLAQALMGQNQQASGAKGETFENSQDGEGLNFLDHFSETKKSIIEGQEGLVFAAMPTPLPYQQNINIYFEDIPESSSYQQILLTQEQANSLMPEELNLENLEINPESQSTIFKGISGEVKRVDEILSKKLEKFIPQDKNDDRSNQIASSEEALIDKNSLDFLAPEVQKIVKNNPTLTPNENQEGIEGVVRESEFPPTQNTNLEENSKNSSDVATSSTQDSSQHIQKNDKTAPFLSEFKSVQDKDIGKTAAQQDSISVQAHEGDTTFTGTLKADPSPTLSKPQVMDQIFTRLDFPMLKQKGDQKISIVLDPRELGRMDIELHMDGDKVNAVFKADQQALNFARNDADKLAQMLRDQGFNASSQNFQFQERPSQDAQYARLEKTYGSSFSLEEGTDGQPLKIPSMRYNVGVFGRSYDAVI